MLGTLFSGPEPSVGRTLLSAVPQGPAGVQPWLAVGHPPCVASASNRPPPPRSVLWPRQTGRSAFQCLQTYQQHSPALKRKEWTEEEDRVLSQLVQEMRVGSHIPYRRSESHAREGGGPGRALVTAA